MLFLFLETRHHAQYTLIFNHAASLDIEVSYPIYWRSKRYKRSKWVGPQEMEIFSGSKFLNLTHWSHCSEWWWDCSGLCWARISRFALGGSAWTPCACFRVCSDLFQGTGTGTRTGKRVHFRGRLISFNASNLRINEGATLHMEMLAARRRSWEAIRAVRCGAVRWFGLIWFGGARRGPF